MKKIILSDRTHSPAYFDMTAQHPPSDAEWNFGYGFRIGDKAVAHIRCLDWRCDNPSNRLVILDDPFMQGTATSRCLTADWLFPFADEIWQTEEAEEPLPLPGGVPLYDRPLWSYWTSEKEVQPIIKVNCGVPFALPAGYVTLQPLVDAAYNIYRNATPNWWYALAAELGKTMPVVLLGDFKLGAYMPCPRSATPLYAYGLTAMESLAVISGARLHIGGETGTTVWSPILGVPTVGLYSDICSFPGWDTFPKSFGKPVLRVGLGNRVDHVVEKIVAAL